MRRLAIVLMVDGCGETLPAEEIELYLLTEPAKTPGGGATGKREFPEKGKKALTEREAKRTFRVPLLQGGAAW
jgi:hypothetical protein